MEQIHLVASFHYDVAYLESFRSYLPKCFNILDEALEILASDERYTFLIEQVILLEEYWERFPQKRELIRKFVSQGRLELSPGMYVMPDMNHVGGEPLFMQALVGKQWLSEKLQYEPDTCWIADCWGHHAQLPQMLSQSGYRSYFLWRCMRRDVLKNEFRWRGIDGTEINTHWLARSYGDHIHFPSSKTPAGDSVKRIGSSSERFAMLWELMQKYGPSDSALMCNGGDFLFPQNGGPQIVEEVNKVGTVPPIRFSTLSKFIESVDWPSKPVVDGEFNSAFQGSFTSNIRIKQLNRQLTNRLLGLESLAVCAGRPMQCLQIWKLLLKQEFHDIICGTICDEALTDSYGEFAQASAMMDQATAELDAGGPLSAFNSLSFERTELIEHQGTQLKVTMPPVGAAVLEDAEVIAPCAEPHGNLPRTFENAWYRAAIDESGFITSLVCRDGRELVRPGRPAFGTLAMQHDNGDLWLNFDSPLNGGSFESGLDQNHPDPFSRSLPTDIANRQTKVSDDCRAVIVRHSKEELLIEQTGTISMQRRKFSFVTRIRFCQTAPRIEYVTRFTPNARNVRIRVAFPTSIADGKIRHEIPFGIQERGPHEHPAQNWIDYSDETGGLALLNRGNPGNNVDDGIMMLSLFRSVAMDYKCDSNASYNLNVPHEFAYAIMPHTRDADTEIVRQATAFNNPPILARPKQTDMATGWRAQPDNVFISCLRQSGDCAFVRLYEAVGQHADGGLIVPARFGEFAPADGLQRPTGPFQKITGQILLRLRPFEIQAFLLR